LTRKALETFTEGVDPAVAITTVATALTTSRTLVALALAEVFANAQVALQSSGTLAQHVRATVSAAFVRATVLTTAPRIAAGTVTQANLATTTFPVAAPAVAAATVGTTALAGAIGYAVLDADA